MVGKGAKVAIVTGVNGQDGSYLAELLLEKGYIVHGVLRRSSFSNTGKIDHLTPNPYASNGSQFHLHYGDLTDSTCLIHLLVNLKPDEIYNLAAQSHVRVSFDIAKYTLDVDGGGTLRMLEAIRAAGIDKTCRFYQASTSELYGLVQETPQKETTPFYPRSPYACAKLYGFWITKLYREAYGMFAVNGILFNHESPRRGENFVTRKVTKAAAEIATGHQEVLELGNLDALRDWGHARDYVEAMWRMLNKVDEPHDFVISTGEQHSVRELCEVSFARVGIKLKWQGKGVDEVGVDAKTGKVRIKINPHFFRPAEVESLLGDASKAKQMMGWTPNTTFHALVAEMVDHDFKMAKTKVY